MTAGGTPAAFLVTGAGVVVAAPPSLAEALPTAILRITGREVTHLVHSHDHADHTAGASAYGDVVRIAHTAAAERIRAAQDPGRPRPTVTFDDRCRPLNRRHEPARNGGRHQPLDPVPKLVHKSHTSPPQFWSRWSRLTVLQLIGHEATINDV
ncbi:hypothetical protein [Streptomyces sp. bgisy034]|uniref:hypothetical protein n=1 Tax=Streptomyces sp. bgisy034 TaxID=3413774 RepID=UPI003EBAECBD